MVDQTPSESTSRYCSFFVKKRELAKALRLPMERRSVSFQAVKEALWELENQKTPKELELSKAKLNVTISSLGLKAYESLTEDVQ